VLFLVRYATFHGQIPADNQRTSLKIKVGRVSHVPLAVEEFGANIVEIGIQSLSQKMLGICREYGVKVMVNHLKKEPEVFRQILDWDVDMVNVDHGDLFARIAEEHHSASA
jgi:hypothetical protein